MIGRELGDAGIVEQRVDSAGRGGGLGDSPTIGVLGHVALGQHRPGPFGLDELGGLFGVFSVAGEVDDHQAGAAPGDLDGDRAAQAR